MPGLIYTKAEIISLKTHPDYAEKWVRDRLAEDPSVLGLGPLILREVERTQPRAGRLDLLFSDPLDHRRYEVELMLGPMDESHVIRAIEYWDSERKRAPRHEHYAVLVAEQVGPRFLNILELFSPVIPIIAVQMIALRVNEYLALQFIRVHDGKMSDRMFDRGADRREERQFVSDVPNLAPALMDECLAILRSIDPTITLDQRRDMVALARGETRTECLSFFPHRDFLGVKARVRQKEDWLARLESAGIVVLSGGPLRKRTHFRLTLDQVKDRRDLLRELFEACMREQGFLV
jgi:hypothetical protein